MPYITLTEFNLKNLQPRPKQFEIFDDKIPGFAIRVSPGGSKSFVLLYRIGKKSRRWTLGRYPTLSLAEARQKARDALASIIRGVDPARVKIEFREKYDSLLFYNVVRNYIEHYAQVKTHSWKETENIITRVFVKHWENAPITKITRIDVTGILRTLVKRSPSSANRSFAVIRAFFNWCVSEGLITHSPCLGVKMPSRAQSRDRVLTDNEIIAIWKGCDQIGYPFGPMTKLLFLTGQRRNEVAKMEWAEIDLEQAIWTQPASKNKSGRKHLVPLTHDAVEVLQTVPKLHDELVFPARGKDRAASGFSKWKAKLDQLSGVTGWTLHDIRRTVATKLASLNIPIHVTELILNHFSTKLSGVTAIYNRHEYLQERREALKRWADHLSGLLYKAKP
jgi:integrase